MLALSLWVEVNVGREDQTLCPGGTPSSEGWGVQEGPIQETKKGSQ